MMNINTNEGITCVKADGDIAVIAADCIMVLQEFANIPDRIGCNKEEVNMFKELMLNEAYRIFKEGK